jgi:hypothetical protein
MIFFYNFFFSFDEEYILGIAMFFFDEIKIKRPNLMLARIFILYCDNLAGYTE